MAETISNPLQSGVETLAVRAAIGSRPSDSALYDLDRHSSPAFTRYSVRKPPPGLSRLSLLRRPLGWGIEAEANLTTLLHGKGSEVGSLSAGEVPLALGELLRVIRGQLPKVRVPDEPWMYDVTRFDPSTTLRLPESLTPSDVVRSVHKVWAARRQGRQVLSLIDSTGPTVTYRVTADLSRSVYDKSAQARTQGKPCPDNVVRLESRVRPEPFPLSSEGALVTESSSEITSIASAMVGVTRAATMVTMETLIEAQKALGEEPNVNEAVTLTTVHDLLLESGDVSNLTQHGMALSTAYRHRARLRKLLTAADEKVQDRAAENVFGLSEVLLARHLMAEMNPPEDS